MNNYRVPELTLKIGRYSNGHGSKYLNELHAETGIYIHISQQYRETEFVTTIITAITYAPLYLTQNAT
jgi:hypothetical protein